MHKVMMQLAILAERNSTSDREWPDVPDVMVPPLDPDAPVVTVADYSSQMYARASCHAPVPAILRSILEY